MSRLRANQITNENANGSPNFPHGLTVTGIVTASSLNSTATQIVAAGIVTANSGGVDTVGVVTATSFKGDGSNLTGIDATQIATGNTKVQTVASRIDNKIVQFININFFSSILTQCSKAVATNHGINEAFSTGSQNHQPPQPNS